MISKYMLKLPFPFFHTIGRLKLISKQERRNQKRNFVIIFTTPPSKHHYVIYFVTWDCVVILLSPALIHHWSHELCYASDFTSTTSCKLLKLKISTSNLTFNRGNSSASHLDFTLNTSYWGSIIKVKKVSENVILIKVINHLTHKYCYASRFHTNEQICTQMYSYTQLNSY